MSNQYGQMEIGVRQLLNELGLYYVAGLAGWLMGFVFLIAHWVALGSLLWLWGLLFGLSGNAFEAVGKLGDVWNREFLLMFFGGMGGYFACMQMKND